MSDRGRRANRGGHRPPPRGRPGPSDRHRSEGAPARGGAGVQARRLDDGSFTLVHPRCVEERRDDYEEGLAVWREGEPDEAREILRFALEGCGDNLWIHAALGWIALKEDRDAVLARGHFGYAFELARRALPPGFAGRLPRDRPGNRPLYDAIDGLAACLEALGEPSEARDLRRLAAAWSGESPPA